MYYLANGYCLGLTVQSVSAKARLLKEFAQNVKGENAYFINIIGAQIPRMSTEVNNNLG